MFLVRTLKINLIYEIYWCQFCFCFTIVLKVASTQRLKPLIFTAENISGKFCSMNVIAHVGWPQIFLFLNLVLYLFLL